MESFQDEEIVSTTTTGIVIRRRQSRRGSIEVQEPRGSDVACSYSFFFLLVLLAMIILAITLGVTIPTQQNQNLRTGNDNPPTTTTNDDQPSPSPVGTTPSSPTVSSATLSPAAMTKQDYLRSLVKQWSGSEVDQTATPAHLAFGWLSTVDPQNLGKDSSERDIRQRYIAAVIYFALQGQSWQSSKYRQRQLQEMRTIFGFLSGKDVCNWNMDSMGISCDGDGNIEIIQLCKFVVRSSPVSLAEI